MLEIQPCPFMSLLDDLIRIVLDKRIKQAYSHVSQRKDKDSHIPHTKRHFSAYKVYLSTIETIFSLDILWIDALVIDHPEEDVAETSPSDDQTIYEEF